MNISILGSRHTSGLRGCSSGFPFSIRGPAEGRFRFGDGRSWPCLAAEERVESAQHVDAHVVVQLRELVWREEFAAGALVVGGVAAGHALRVAGGADVDGLLAEQLAEPFGGGLLVAAEEQHRIAVADDGLPGVPVHGLELGDGLQDDADADLA